MPSYEVIVVGLGAVGSAATWQRVVLTVFLSFMPEMPPVHGFKNVE
jgi:hypothetical protein